MNKQAFVQGMRDRFISMGIDNQDQLDGLMKQAFGEDISKWWSNQAPIDRRTMIGAGLGGVAGGLGGLFSGGGAPGALAGTLGGAALGGGAARFYGHRVPGMPGYSPYPWRTQKEIDVDNSKKQDQDKKEDQKQDKTNSMLGK